MTPEEMEGLENQWDMLKGKLDQLKRDSTRGGGGAETPRDPLQPLQNAAAAPVVSAAVQEQVYVPATSRLEALRRDSSFLLKQRDSGTRATIEEQPAFEMGGQFSLKGLASFAEEVFSEPSFKELCDKGLNQQLQRTKDGATKDSRIEELAGISRGHKLSC